MFAQITPVFLILLERLGLYDTKFLRAQEHIAANCTGVDEEFVELINSLVARAFDLHAKGPMTHLSRSRRGSLGSQIVNE